MGQEALAQSTVQRQQVRIETEIPVNCYLEGIGDKKVTSEKFLPAIIKNISSGGVLLFSQLSLPLETIIVFEIPIEKEKIITTVKVLRNRQEKDGYYMGSQFLALDDKDKQKIMAYVFRQQLKQNRKK